MSFFERIKEIMGEEEAASNTRAASEPSSPEVNEVDLNDPTSVTTVVTQDKEAAVIAPVVSAPVLAEPVEQAEKAEEGSDSDYEVPFFRESTSENRFTEVSEPGLFDDLTDMAEAVAESPAAKEPESEPEKPSIVEQYEALPSVEEMKKSIEMKDLRIKELEGLLNDLNIRNDQLFEANELMRSRLCAVASQIKDLRAKLSV